MRDWNDANLPILSSLLEVEARYRDGAEQFRQNLKVLEYEVRAAESRLRRFGLISDLQRIWRVKRGGEYYTSEEMRVVERLMTASDVFLDDLPVTRPGHSSA